jgi:Mg2+ and Co2+ transporter CorA
MLIEPTDLEAAAAVAPTAIWAFDFIDGAAIPVTDFRTPGAGFRWLHFSLADQRSRSWIASADLPTDARELLLSNDDHQRALIEEGTIACVVHDFIREFEQTSPTHTGPLHFALSPQLMITARKHPVRCADLIHRSIDRGARPLDRSAALDLLTSALLQVATQTSNDILATIHRIEDALLGSTLDANARALPPLRRRSVHLHRQLNGLHRVFHRLEEDEELPDDIRQTVEKLIQRIAAIESDVGSIQEQTRLLREELDLRESQRTNRNLYVLSIMTALMLPATLVTGIFGMNTGGLPLAQGSYGTIAACFIALASAAGAYLLLRITGFLGGEGG